MSKKDEYFKMMESQIEKWDAEVDKLRAKSVQMSADARTKYDEQIKVMRANRDAADCGGYAAQSVCDVRDG